MMTDTNQAVVWEAVYLPFGGIHSITGSASLNQRFPGQYFQMETGLHYNWHRHYDPTTGRYIQADPLGMPDGPSRYAYVNNSPLMYVDPEGLKNGGIFKNKEGLLPIMPHGYYRIIHGPGPERWVIGKCGERFYSPDHYGTFIGPY